MSPAACPHCLLVIAADDVPDGFPPQPMRCPHCRLTVAAGRARTDVDPGHAASGSAAGVLASAARREEGPPVTREAVADALRFASEKVGVTVARLRMIDYQQVAEAHPHLPGLSSILDQHGSWKGARTAVSGAAGPGSAPAR